MAESGGVPAILTASGSALILLPEIVKAGDNDGVKLASATAEASVTLTPMLIIQLAGVAIGVAGVVIGYLRWREHQITNRENVRSNDLTEKRLEYDIAKSNNNKEKAAEKQQASGSSGKGKKTSKKA